MMDNAYLRARTGADTPVSRRFAAGRAPNCADSRGRQGLTLRSGSIGAPRARLRRQEPARTRRSMPSKRHSTAPQPSDSLDENTRSAEPNLNDIAYATIKDDIISCALQPGEEVSEGVLVARYGMSKAPIRSAMMRLRQEGLIVSRGRQGNAVSPVTLRDIQEIFQLRLVLDVTAVRLAAGKVDAARLRALNEAAHTNYPESDRAGQAAYLRANREFHRYVAECTGNQRLVTLVVGLMEQHERIVHLGLAMQRREHEFHHFHDDLVDALIEGDGERAAELTENALRGSQRKVMEALTDSPAQISLGPMDLTP